MKMFTQMVYKTERAEYVFKIVGNYEEGFVAVCYANGLGTAAVGGSFEELTADIVSAVDTWEKAHPR